MGKLSQLIESPYTALILAILFGAMAVSGRLSVIASQALFFAAWVVVSCRL
jgi:hypothetical protein